MLIPPRSAVLAAFVLCVFPAMPQAGPDELRARAWDALRSRVEEQKYLNHSLAVEAIMRELAAPSRDDRDEWGLAGLLHDIDIQTTANDPTRHGVAGAQILSDLGFSAAIVHAVKAHDDRSGIARTTRLDHALYCADQLYWLIMAAGPKAIWEDMQAIPSKRAILPKVSKECAEIGLDMPRTIEAAHAALRKLSPAMTR